MKLINLTPHVVTIIGDFSVQDISTSGSIARVIMKSERIGTVIKNVPLVAQRLECVVGLPEPQPNVSYIVSSLVLQALKAQGIQRNDCYAPDTSPDGIVKNYGGKTMGVRGLTQTVVGG